MINRLSRHLFLLLTTAMLNQQKKAAIELVRIEAATLYVRAVQTGRAITLGLVGLIAFLVLFVSGFLLVHFGLYAILPWTQFERGLLILILGMVYLLIVLIGLAVMTSERRWMRMTGASDIVERAARQCR